MIFTLAASLELIGQERDSESAGFVYTAAIAQEPGVARRDPSDIIRVGSKYYVWYTKSLALDEGFPSGYPGTLWFAASPDGLVWEEQGEALGKGPVGAWDEHGVFTPNILAAGGRYFLFYTGVPEPFSNLYGTATPTAIGAAVAYSPDGPWARIRTTPVLMPGKHGEWDDFRVDDACLVVRNGKYLLYYKGVDYMENWWTHTPMGVAVSDDPEGPYRKWNLNPLVEPGHEVLVWSRGTGLAALVSRDGIWRSADGINFSRYLSLPKDAIPQAPGAYRDGNDVSWGICQKYLDDGSSVFLQRFDYAGER